ncbi:MAG: amidohydrolase family protein [Bacteroidales bacterium]|nr:amidohydrolase family protein [Bacteroidales bacterium]
MGKFYDMHMHAFDLSHPNLVSFLFRDDLFDKIPNRKIRKISLLGPVGLLLPGLIKKGLKKIIEENLYIKNTLSFYEIPIEYQFLLVDYFLKSPDNPLDKIVETNNEFVVDGETCNKIVLCPLSIDFGYKNIDQSGVFYNKAPQKPIAKQIGDLFLSINTYYRFELSPGDYAQKLQLKEIKKPLDEIKQDKLFEIYPFMGLNTQNYTLDKLKGTASETGLLDKYFSEFSNSESPETRRQRLYAKMGSFDGKMYEDDGSIYKNIFTGIKVYPQLGFDPLPETSNQQEREKVEFLYEYCIARRIPIIAHCSDGGFKSGNFDKLTNPALSWKKVIEKYPELTLCLAHFGHQKTGATDWQKTIIGLTKAENIYTDISCNDSNDAYYKQLNNVLKTSGDNLSRKVLFGSDFSINMYASKVSSYNQYLNTFIHTGALENKKDLFFTNPEKFLFGN